MEIQLWPRLSCVVEAASQRNREGGHKSINAENLLRRALGAASKLGQPVL
jgi:hypothetical protein